MTAQLLDATGRRRSPATIPGYQTGCPPRNNGMRYPADPPRVEEITAVMRAAGDGIHGARVPALIVVMWRAGLRINEVLMLSETDLEPRRAAILVRHGKGGKRREVGMDDWAQDHVEPWARDRLKLPIGPFFCVIDGTHADGHGLRRVPGRSCADSVPQQASVGGSRPTSSGTRMPSKWPAKAYRYPSTSGSSDMPTRESRLHISKESTRARSSTPSTAAEHQ